jgi:phosphoglycolate phosphatase-like HAD superfamily hydrolase
VTVPLDGIDLVIFDKDGTLIEFGRMWSGWAVALAEGIQASVGRSVEGPLYTMLGFDPATGRILPGGGLASTPMARLRDRTREVLREAGLSEGATDRALESAWHAPDPVGLARPLTDLHALFGRLHDGGRLVAVATSDDREPTERTLEALGVAGEIDALVCADDGVTVKPAPGMVAHLCAALGVPASSAAVVGDAPADMQMARAAGAGLTVAVLTGVGDRDDLAPLADVVLGSVAELL